MKLTSRVFACVNLLTAVSAVGDTTIGRACRLQESGVESSLVYVRVRGQPEIWLQGPEGKSIRARKGAVLQNDFPGQAEAYSVPPSTQLALKDPPTGRWRLRIRAIEECRLVVSVIRSSANGRITCDAADTMFVRRDEARWWDVEWSAGGEQDSCWVRLTRNRLEGGRRTK